MRQNHLSWGEARETRDGWPLLTVETEVNGDSQSTNERGHSLVGSLRLIAVPVQKIFVLPRLFHSAPVQNNFFLTVHLFNYFVPIGQQAGQAAVLGRHVS